MYDVMRVAVEQCQAKLPSHLPNLSFREVLPLLLLLIDKCLHISIFCHFHGDVEALGLLFRTRVYSFIWILQVASDFRRSHWRCSAVDALAEVPIVLYIFRVPPLRILHSLERLFIDLAINKGVVELDYVWVLNLFHYLHFIYDVFVLFCSDILSYPDLFQRHDPLQILLPTFRVFERLVCFVNSSVWALAQDNF